MKKIFSWAAAITLAAVMAVGTASCGDKEESSGTNLVGGGPADGKDVADEDMPYGAHVTELTSEIDENISIMIGFDNRYLGEGGQDYSEVYLVDSYFDALNRNDVAAVKACYYPGYLEALSGDDSFDSPEEFISTYRAELENTFGAGFNIEFIDISNCQLSGDTEAETMFSIRDSSLAEVFGDSILDKITSRKLLTIAGNSYYTLEGGGWGEITSVLPEGIFICVYEIDGKPYIF